MPHLDLRTGDLTDLLIRDRIRVLELQGPSTEPSQIGQGHPHRDALGVASYILGSATSTQVLALFVVRLTT